jgi:hypothetical protein
MPDKGAVVPLDETDGVGEKSQNKVDVLANGVADGMGPGLPLVCN